jgi:D-alanyl-D-alanine carboxypeptidase/D-alanyl-D-alanine-endopeptidase (penicillin-binding protein 4)
MNRKLWLSLCLFGMASMSQANSVESSLNHLISRTDPNINMGMMVVDLTTGNTLYQHQANQLMSPASNMKLFSQAAAMLALGPEYEIPTTLSTDAKTLTNGRLNGSLYLHMPADPSFNHQALFALFNQLRNLGIQEITGDVIIQSDLASASPYPPGMTPRDEQYSYGAPVAPLILDENRLTVIVNPASKVGLPAVVETLSPEGVFDIDNQVVTRDSPKGCGVSVVLDNMGKIHAKGCVVGGQMALQFKTPIKYPVAYLADHVQYKLNQMGIAFHGNVKLGHMPATTIEIAKHHSKPLRHLMGLTLKPSDNLYANALYLLAANHIRQAPSNWTQAQDSVRQFLQQQTGINMANAVFGDGSGLSRFNRVTAYQTMSLLTYFYDRFPIAYEYISALPISGFDGTLKRRLNQSYQKGMIRAKTGTMTGIYSLSGYLVTKNRHTVAFAIYINRRADGHSRMRGSYRDFIDQMCSILLKSEPSNLHHPLFFYAKNNPMQKATTALDLSRRQLASWRNLEFLIKKELRSQPVTVVYHQDELIILDTNSHDSVIWNAIKKIKNNRNIGVAVESLQAPNLGSDALNFLWVQKTPLEHANRRWIIRSKG